MTSSSVRVRQVMDISAAVWGGVVAGLVLLIIQMIFAVGTLGGSIWMPFYWNSAIFLGQSILMPPVGFAAVPVLLGLLIHFFFAIIFGVLIAFVVHRGGMPVGIIGGGLLGLTLYAVDYYLLSDLLPWFYNIRGWEMTLGHIIYGAVAGGIYEGLEVEEFEPVEA